MKIAILGCGWLGLPLAKELLAKRHSIKGSTTSSQKLDFLSSEGIQPFLIKISSEGVIGDISGFLSETELLLINIPPALRRNQETNFVGSVGRLVKDIEASGIKKVVFVSSTSVYKDTSAMPTYSEKDATNGNSKAARQLVASEDLLRENRNFSTCILRFGGLIGPSRHPVEYLSGRKNISNPLAPVNLIHQKDCIGIVVKILEKGTFPGIYNAVFSGHPLKKDYYTSKAREAGLEPPQFDEASPSEGKIIDSSKVIRELGYEFQQGGECYKLLIGFFAISVLAFSL